jgi:hypothetical protein
MIIPDTRPLAALLFEEYGTDGVFTDVDAYELLKKKRAGLVVSQTGVDQYLRLMRVHGQAIEVSYSQKYKKSKRGEKNIYRSYHCTELAKSVRAVPPSRWAKAESGEKLSGEQLEKVVAKMGPWGDLARR